MSGYKISIIPSNPSSIPSENDQNICREYLTNKIRTAADISTFISETIEFVDCGENFETITCPSCNTELYIDWWQEKMETDYLDDGFLMNKFKTPCCGNTLNLNDLKYHFNQGFAKFRIDITNNDSFELSNKEIIEIERILKMPIKIINTKI